MTLHICLFYNSYIQKNHVKLLSGELMDELLSAYAKLWFNRLQASQALGIEEQELILFAYLVIKSDIKLLFLQDPFER